MTFVSNRLKAQVMQALIESERPLKTSEVALLVGRSSTATRAALEQSEATRLPVSPVEWYVESAQTRRVKSKHNDREYVVMAKDVEGILDVWNMQRITLGKSISDLEITSKTDVSSTAEKLGTLAGSVAALAYAMQQVADKPDWYEILSAE